jgi:flagellar hook-associated protein 2
MSQGLFSIGGIASGLDTTNIIEQLMQLERLPVNRMKNQQTQLNRVKDAWGQINTKLSSLRAASDKINRPDRFDGFMTVTSSNTDAVGVTATGNAPTGSLSFTVQQLATRMQRSSTDVFDSRDAGLAGRDLQITAADGTVHRFGADELGTDVTLADLVKAVNASGSGVRASTLQTSPGQFRLVLEAKETGEVNTFGVSGSGWDDAAFAPTQDARNAQLVVGGIAIERSSNTIADLVDGATLTLKKTTDTAVSVTAARDVDGAYAAVKGFVDALNGVLGTLKDMTAYNAESKTAGVLQGDASARQLATSLRDAVSRPVPGSVGTQGLASALGITIKRDGTLDLDAARVKQAFTTDFDGTVASLAQSSSTTDPAGRFLSTTGTTVSGTYGVQVTRAAEVARVIGAGFSPPGETEPKTFRVAGPNGRTVDVTITSTESTVALAVAKINEALRAAGQNELSASENGGEIQLASTRYGSAVNFTVSELDTDGEVVDGGGAFGLEGSHTGEDVAGTIGGLAATGAGRTLTGSTGAASGLAVQVTGQPAAFDITWSRGIVGQLGAALSRAEGIQGTVSRARQAVDRQVAIYQTRIDGFEQRLISREATIRRQFVGMETMLGQLNAQGNWLGQQLAGLNAMNQQ